MKFIIDYEKDVKRCEILTYEFEISLYIIKKKFKYKFIIYVKKLIKSSNILRR